TQFFERSRKIFHRKTMATRVPGAGLQRYTYADYADRVCRLSAALASLGLQKGDRVGTFAWNSHRHMEVYFAAPLMGMVLHTVNIRLSPQDLTYIINHAEDRVLIVDASLWHLLEPIKKDLKSVKHFIVKGLAGGRDPRGDVRLRDPGSRRETRRGVAKARRDRRRRHVLHLRHDGASQGRGLHPPRGVPPLFRLVHGGRARYL